MFEHEEKIQFVEDKDFVGFVYAERVYRDKVCLFFGMGFRFV